MFLLVEKFHFAEVFSGSELKRNHIRLIDARQNHFHGSLGHDVEASALVPSVRIMVPAS